MRPIIMCLLVCLVSCASPAQTAGTFISNPNPQPPLNPSQYPQVAPGQIVSFTIAGLSPQANQPLAATSLPLPMTLAGISAQVSGLNNPTLSVPLLAIDPSATCPDTSNDSAPCLPVMNISVEIPMELHSSNQVGAGGDGSSVVLVISDQFGRSASIALQLIWSAVQVLVSCPSGYIGCSPVVTNADGSSLGVVHGGDVLVAYVYGLGKTVPPIPSGLPAPATPLSQTYFPVALNFAFQPNAGPLRLSNYYDYALQSYPVPLFAGAVPGFVGLYQVNMQVPPVPPGTPPCNPGTVDSNLTVTILTLTSLDGFAVCAQ